ncbi:hypothetical protein HK098_006949 [Nowakowskiella sp. JEL0407]|nr:hypothetical protein HK098_006949 [Nowakowskiella sp. JEL0407]
MQCKCSISARRLWEKIDELKPQRYTIPDNNQVNAMDVILDILPRIHDEFVRNPHESDLDWNTRHAELLEQEYAAWKIAQLALDVILNQTLGWKRLVEGEIEGVTDGIELDEEDEEIVEYM